MASTFQSIFLLSLLFMTLVSSTIHPGEDTKSLYLRWPAGYCLFGTECCWQGRSLKNIFLIDHLSDASAACNHDPFSVELIESLSKNLRKFWPGLECPSQPAVTAWKKAWDEYGVCSGLDENSYFKKSLDLLKRSNVLTHLVQSGHFPTNTQSYLQRELEDAINQGLGVKAAVLICKGELVSGVQLCVDESASKYVDCPADAKSNCPETVGFNVLTFLKNSAVGEEDNNIEMLGSE